MRVAESRLGLACLLAPLLFFPAGAASAAVPPAEAAQKWLEHGRGQIRIRQYKSAVQSLLNAAGYNPDDPAIHKELGNAHYYNGNLAGAEQAYRRSLQLNPADQALAAFIQKLEAAKAPPAAPTPTPAPSAPPTPPPAAKTAPPNRAIPALLSAALPGAGQVYNKQWDRALSFGVPTIALLSVAGVSLLSSQAAQARMDDPAASWRQRSDAKTEWENTSHMVLVCGVPGLAMYLMTILDAAKHAKSAPTQGFLGRDLEVAWLGQGVQARWALARF